MDSAWNTEKQVNVSLKVHRMDKFEPGNSEGFSSTHRSKVDEEIIWQSSETERDVQDIVSGIDRAFSPEHSSFCSSYS